MTDDRTLERAARSWIEEGPTRAPDRPIDTALRTIQTTPQESGRRIPSLFTNLNPRVSPFAMAAVVAVIVVGAAVVALRPSSNFGGQPTPSPTIVPSESPSPAIPTRPPGLATQAPLVPVNPLPDPTGAALPSELIGRTYLSDPPEIQGTQTLILTLRAANDPHCLAMYGGRSTCFTILWEPNYPKHTTDPGVRGPARIVAGNLALGFALVEFDPACQGSSSTYAIVAGGATLTAIDAPACSFQGFRQQ